MNTPTMVRTIHHLEHYAMLMDSFLGSDHCTMEQLETSIKVAWEDNNYRRLGKFRSALDERVWETTMEGCEETGDVEYYGHHCLVPFSVDDLVDLGVLGRWHDFSNVPVGCIVTSFNSGAVDVSYYDTGAELDKAWEECEAESNCAQEWDTFLTHDRGKWTISSEGRSEGSYDDRREALFMMYYNMNNDGYWPNMWEIDDHGNETQLFTNNKVIAEVLNDYVEFRDEEEAQAG